MTDDVVDLHEWAQDRATGPHAGRIERRRNMQLEIDVFRAEQDRLYVLLADALQLASAGQAFGPDALLEVLAARRGFNLARSHYYEERDRKRKTAELVRLLRDTDPDRILGRTK